MTIFQTSIVFIVGVVLLGLGFYFKKKWLKLLSIIPFLIVLWQIILLIGMGLG